MQSTAATVVAFLAEVPPERQDVLKAIRCLCLDHLPGYTEGMEYRMPSDTRNGVVEVAFANQKKSVSIYGLKAGVLDEHRADFRGANIGKGCIRYTKPDHIDLVAVERLLRATAASDGTVC